jgi:hypothetical protein
MGDFLLRLRAKKNVSAIRALRRGLKFLWRSCGLRVVSVEEIPPKGGLRAGALSPASQSDKDSSDV